MKISSKILVLALLLMAFPMKQWAQRVRNNSIEIAVSEISNPDMRFCTLAAVGLDDNLLYTVNEEDNSVLLMPKDNWSDAELQSYFDEMKAQVEADFAAYLRADKDAQGDIFTVWKECLPKDLFGLLFKVMLIEDAGTRDGNQTCATSDPFCTTDVITFHVDANPSGSCEPGPNYGCLSSFTARRPYWFHMKIGVAGAFTIRMTNSANVDIDYCCWGPFNDPVSPCPNQLQTIVDCGSSGASTENCHIPSNAQVGKYYIMVITKWNTGTATDITFSKVANSGPGETDCDILPGIANNDGPYCVGETIHLTVNAQEGATYSWTGPGGFTSNQQNPTRPNCTMAMAGTYTCVTTVGTHSVSATTEVVVNPQPTANFTATTVCKGNPTQFTSTSTTNPAGQAITSYNWNFGDGQTSTQQNPSHQYANAGNYTVSLTVGCANNLCTHTKTQSVAVYEAPVANAGPDDFCDYGSTYQLHGNGGTGTFNFHWEPADKVTNPNAQNTQTVPLYADQTFTLTVSNPQGQCTDNDQVTIHISGSAMAVSAGPDISICQGGSGEIYVAAGGGTGNYTYSWTPTTGLSNPNIANPIASPAQTTTYTCHVSDGATSQNVSVTVTVNDVIIEHDYASICPDENYIWHGSSYNGIGTYQIDTVTEQGCDKTLFLHLDHYPTYDETTITEYICAGDSYNFYGTLYDYTCQVAYTDHTIHGCDSIVRLNLTVWPDNGVTTNEVTVCPEQLPYNFYGENYYDEVDVTVWDTDIHGCDSAVRLVLSVRDYYMPPVQHEYKCEPFTWSVNGMTYYETGMYVDTIPTTACEGIFRLDLHILEVPEVQQYTEVACDQYSWPISGQTYTTSGDYPYSFPIYDDPSDPSTLYNCTEDHLLHLTVNPSHTNAETPFNNECDSVAFDWFGTTHYFTTNGTYSFSDGETILGCDTAMRVIVENMRYTPKPCLIAPSDNGDSGAIPVNDSTYAVITNTEFFSFNYEFFIHETGSSRWESCEWSISKPTWSIEPSFNASTNSSFCTVYVADHDDNDVILTATAKSSCGEETRHIRLKSTFFDVDENGNPAAKVDIVPNPNNGQMRLNFENMDGRVRIKVFDMRGNQIDDFETQVTANHQNYDYSMKRNADGIYVFVISDSTRTLMRKAVIIH